MALDNRLQGTPTNQNYVHPHKFRFNIPGMNFQNYFCQSVVMPAVSTNFAQQTAMGRADVKRHGDKLVYDPLNITFYVDEDLRSYEEMYDWLRALTTPHSFSEYAPHVREDIYKDATLSILNNSNLANIQINFKNCHPTDLGSLVFDTTLEPEAVMVADLTLVYDTYEIVRL